MVNIKTESPILTPFQMLKKRLREAKIDLNHVHLTVRARSYTWQLWDTSIRALDRFEDNNRSTNLPLEDKATADLKQVRHRMAMAFQRSQKAMNDDIDQFATMIRNQYESMEQVFVVIDSMLPKPGPIPNGQHQTAPIANMVPVYHPQTRPNVGRQDAGVALPPNPRNGSVNHVNTPTAFFNNSNTDPRGLPRDNEGSLQTSVPTTAVAMTASMPINPPSTATPLQMNGHGGNGQAQYSSGPVNGSSEIQQRRPEPAPILTSAMQPPVHIPDKHLYSGNTTHPGTDLGSHYNPQDGVVSSPSAIPQQRSPPDQDSPNHQYHNNLHTDAQRNSTPPSDNNKNNTTTTTQHPQSCQNPSCNNRSRSRSPCHTSNTKQGSGIFGDETNPVSEQGSPNDLNEGNDQNDGSGDKGASGSDSRSSGPSLWKPRRTSPMKTNQKPTRYSLINLSEEKTRTCNI